MKKIIPIIILVSAGTLSLLTLTPAIAKNNGHLKFNQHPSGNYSDVVRRSGRDDRQSGRRNNRHQHNDHSHQRRGEHHSQNHHRRGKHHDQNHYQQHGSHLKEHHSHRHYKN